MEIPASAALWFLPFVLPICFYVAFTDMREMRIKNHAVVTLTLVFVVVGLIVLPPWATDWSVGGIGPLTISLPPYAWHLINLVIVLIFGILFNSAGLVGAGDAKFCAAAAPFIWSGDLVLLMAIFTATTLGAFFAHRLAKYTGLRRIAPEWESWDKGKLFPMGLALAGTLVIYLILGSFYGS